MSRYMERALAMLCYVGALRVPVVALVVPEWAFTIPSGLVITGAAWWLGRKRSPFLLHHAREGFKWSLQSNLLLAAIALVSMAVHQAWDYSGISLLQQLWRFCATLFRWAGGLVSILTLVIMYKAARGGVGDVFTAAR